MQQLPVELPQGEYALRAECGSARKNDAPAAVQATIANVAGLASFCGVGGLIHTTSG